MLGFKVLVVVAALAMPVAVESRLTRPSMHDVDVSNHTVGVGYVQLFSENEEAKVKVMMQKDLGNGLLDNAFVYDDPRATWRDSDNIKIAVKEGRMSEDPDLYDPVGWAYKSITAWTETTKCSKAEFDVVVGNSSQVGFFQQRYATGISDLSLVEADLTIQGFAGEEAFPFFSRFYPGRILGVCIYLFWLDSEGNPTDIDGDGKYDVAFREIYFNDLWRWSDLDETPRFRIDFPTVAIHEVGHGLSLSHFGTTIVKEKGYFAKPRAAMNTFYHRGKFEQRISFIRLCVGFLYVSFSDFAVYRPAARDHWTR